MRGLIFIVGFVLTIWRWRFTFLPVIRKSEIPETSKAPSVPAQLSLTRTTDVQTVQTRTFNFAFLGIISDDWSLKKTKNIRLKWESLENIPASDMLFL